MVCSICKKEITRKIKVKKGCICPDCFSHLPDAVKNCITSFTPKNLTEILRICHPHTEQSRLRINRLHICDHSIQVNDWEIGIKDIKHISLNFHPTRGTENATVCCGYITVIVETKKPHILIEEPFNDREILVKYHINGKNITYLYSTDANQIIGDVQTALLNNEDSFSRAIQRMAAKRQKRTHPSSSQQSNNGKKNNFTKNEPLSPFAEARKMFGVEIPYTKQVLDQRKKALLQQWHPDHNMSNREKANEMTILILKSYELLLKQAD